MPSIVVDGHHTLSILYTSVTLYGHSGMSFSGMRHSGSSACEIGGVVVEIGDNHLSDPP